MQEVSSHTFPFRYPAEYLKETLCWSLGFSLCAALPPPLLCSVNSSCSVFLVFSATTPESKEVTILYWLPISCTTAQKLSQDSKLSNNKAHLVSIFQEYHYLMSNILKIVSQILSIFFFFFFFVIGRRVRLIHPCYSFLARSLSFTSLLCLFLCTESL